MRSARAMGDSGTTAVSSVATGLSVRWEVEDGTPRAADPPDTVFTSAGRAAESSPVASRSWPAGQLAAEPMYRPDCGGPPSTDQATAIAARTLGSSHFRPRLLDSFFRRSDHLRPRLLESFLR